MASSSVSASSKKDVAAEHKSAFLMFNTLQIPFSCVVLVNLLQKIVSNKVVKLVGKLSEKGTSLRINGSEEIFHGEALSSKYLARFMASVGGENILSGDALQATQIDTFIQLASSVSTCVAVLTVPVAAPLPKVAKTAANSSTAASVSAPPVVVIPAVPVMMVALFEQLNTHLAMRTFLVADQWSLADLAIWSALLNNRTWKDMPAATAAATLPHLARWFNTVDNMPACREANPLAEEIARQLAEKSRKAATGSLDIGLSRDTLMGKVVTRFPPEPSGYLHIGHAKAALLNHHYARDFQGSLILRFDDTNPSKEKEEFEQQIMADLATLEIKHDKFSHTSDHFEMLLEYGERMLRMGKSYIDTTNVDQMREERNNGVESACRGHSVEENLRLWAEMKVASAEGQRCCMRAKIDMKSDNGTLRDPTLYRCNLTPHHMTGTKYKIYPTYDFACPIVDSFEGVTHAMRSSEYHDRNVQYEWIVDAFGLRKPAVIEFSRMNFVYTTLSKRKLTWFVNQGLVEGWNDPRFPTVQGMMRRGLVVPALKEFVIKQGFSKSANNMEWDQIWATNKRHIDPTAHRYVAVSSEGMVPLTLENYDAATMGLSTEVPVIPKNVAAGNRTLNFGGMIWLEKDDAVRIELGEEVTLMHWGNAIVKSIIKNEAGDIVSMGGVLNLQGDFTTTAKKITFIADRPAAALGRVRLVELDHLITKAKLGDDESFEDFVTPQSWFNTDAVSDLSIRQNLHKGQIIQLERRGYFICDENPADLSQPMQLLFIPDGRSQAMSTLSSKVQLKMN